MRGLLDKPEAEGAEAMSPKLLPILLIVIDVCAAAVYAKHGDWHRVGYWICAAGITYFATFSA